MAGKRITIIRHGMPDAHHNYPFMRTLKGSELITYIHDWNNCELSSKNIIPDQLKSILNDADYFVNSSLKRTKDSFALLGIIKTNSLELLNEAELPHGFLKNLKLPLWIWGATIRFLWILGLKKNAESYKEFKKRVENAYFHLSAHSETYNHIAVMGHGFVNRQLKMILQQNGWVHTKRFGGHGYWSFNTFEKKGIRY